MSFRLNTRRVSSAWLHRGRTSVLSLKSLAYPGIRSQPAPEPVPRLRLHLGVELVRRVVEAEAQLLRDRLEQVYDGIYVRNCDQRTLAAELGISQPRVAKLHAELLKRGRKYFGVAVN